LLTTQATWGLRGFKFKKNKKFKILNVLFELARTFELDFLGIMFGLYCPFKELFRVSFQALQYLSRHIEADSRLQS
jgi:hypothetical protein